MIITWVLKTHYWQNLTMNPGQLPPVSVIYPAYERDRYEVSDDYIYDSSIAYNLSQHHRRHHTQTQTHSVDSESLSLAYKLESPLSLVSHAVDNSHFSVSNTYNNNISTAYDHV